MMFNSRKRMRAIADEAVEAARAKIAAENAKVTYNIDGHFGDGCLLLFARKEGLLSAEVWKGKALAWQVEYGTEGGYQYFGFHPPQQSLIAIAMRAELLKANVEIAAQAHATAKKALALSQKASPSNRNGA